MTEAVKIEIIYYRAEHDVTLEFGLHGDMAMRFRTAEARTLAELIAALKKASRRSEIMVAVGNLERGGMTEALAKSVGRFAVPVSLTGPGSGNVKGDIISESIPLIADGVLCGMVAESNYQSLLVLSDDKARRDKVLESLVVPYLRGRCDEIRNMRQKLYESRFAANGANPQVGDTGGGSPEYNGGEDLRSFSSPVINGGGENGK